MEFVSFYSSFDVLFREEGRENGRGGRGLGLNRTWANVYKCRIVKGQ